MWWLGGHGEPNRVNQKVHGVVGGNEGFIVEGRNDGGLDGEEGSSEVGWRGDVIVVTVFSGNSSFVDFKAEAGVG